MAASTYGISSALVIEALFAMPFSTASSASCPAARNAQVSWAPKTAVGASVPPHGRLERHRETGRRRRVSVPRCQTPEENAEAVVNEATTVYGRDAHGRFTGRPKADA